MPKDPRVLGRLSHPGGQGQGTGRRCTHSLGAVKHHSLTNLAVEADHTGRSSAWVSHVGGRDPSGPPPAASLGPLSSKLELSVQPGRNPGTSDTEYTRPKPGLQHSATDVPPTWRLGCLAKSSAMPPVSPTAWSLPAPTAPTLASVFLGQSCCVLRPFPHPCQGPTSSRVTCQTSQRSHWDPEANADALPSAKSRLTALAAQRPQTRVKNPPCGSVL